MKKRKVKLHRETLHQLESGRLGEVAGNVATQIATCVTACTGCINCPSNLCPTVRLCPTAHLC